MSKAKKVNKAEAVRSYFKANPEAKTGDVVAALKKEGVTVMAGYVSNIKSGLKKSKKRAGRKTVKPTFAEEFLVESPVVKTPKADSVATFEQIRKVAKTLNDIGGLVRLQEALETIREVGGIKKFEELAEAIAPPPADIPF